MQIRPTALTFGLIIYFFMHYFTFTQNSGLTHQGGVFYDLHDI